ncbi:hypothetical protein EYF80_002508 [Liparis tanakae]|uniref:Uncharacterized protein n=1 Tax=Liparis tanakae TaxID=230148 RepID=A0A4Z2JAW0_9TELE|nr:hypothetical protein EYF80_002508 [Liparis tanakae]
MQMVRFSSSKSIMHEKWLHGMDEGERLRGSAAFSSAAGLSWVCPASVLRNVPSTLALCSCALALSASMLFSLISSSLDMVDLPSDLFSSALASSAL